MTTRDQRSRLSLLIGVGVFFFCQAGLTYLVQYHQPAWHDAVYGAKVERLEAQLDCAPPNSHSIVVLGSSRVICGVSGQEAEASFPPGYPATVFNFGITGAGPVVERLTLERLLERGFRPEVVVIEVLPAMFVSDNDGYEIQQYPPEQYLLREHARARSWGAREEYLREARIRSLLLPSYAHRVSMVQDLAPYWLPPSCRAWTTNADAWGHLPMGLPDDPPAELRQRATKSAYAAYSPAVSTFNLGHVGPAALHEILARCRQEHLRSVLLWMPEGPAFRSWYRPGARDEFADYLMNLHREFDCYLIDAQDWMPEEAFADSHHLLPEPGRRFSRRLGKVLAAILQESQSSGTNHQAHRSSDR